MKGVKDLLDRDTVRLDTSGLAVDVLHGLAVHIGARVAAAIGGRRHPLREPRGA